jgi:hypothetical protein
MHHHRYSSQKELEVHFVATPRLQKDRTDTELH